MWKDTIRVHFFHRVDVGACLTQEDRKEMAKPWPNRKRRNEANSRKPTNNYNERFLYTTHTNTHSRSGKPIPIDSRRATTITIINIVVVVGDSSIATAEHSMNALSCKLLASKIGYMCTNLIHWLLGVNIKRSAYCPPFISIPHRTTHRQNSTPAVSK